ncbi:MAG TPA: hypothetical protein VF665_05960 [Longimicrobium sp.]|jgi:hypothetical protein|uniref:hypothetical protein n=1 Tax=Longimicrobium sp. TaxID=2029185 RepID=UPI002ED8C7A0
MIPGTDQPLLDTPDFDSHRCMTTIEQIERAVSGLSPEELTRFREWFLAFDAAAWELQFERDAAAGRLGALAEEALSEHRSGRSRPL